MLKKLLLCSAVALSLYACGDDDSDFIARPDGARSSSSTTKYSSSTTEPYVIVDQFNPKISFGEMVDDRDGRTYKNSSPFNRILVIDTARQRASIRRAHPYISNGAFFYFPDKESAGPVRCIKDQQVD